ncbi:hypothetical protein BJV82DRAFT_718352 [Fennellomyces sp. T-0311]|nr:hypothetical protein BJV82DRAFT_718352 [Fennellomyces sp. T-0311]
MWFKVLLFAVALCTIVHANTEKLVFSTNQPTDSQCHSIHPNAHVLTPPYSTLQRVISPESHHFYTLDQLQPDSSYELRISYPATSPSDFHLELYPVCNDDSRRLLLIKEEYAGVSNIPGMEHASVTYDIVLENLYLGFLFYQVYKVAAAVAIVLLLGQFVLLPKLRKMIYQTIDLKHD